MFCKMFEFIFILILTLIFYDHDPLELMGLPNLDTSNMVSNTGIMYEI